MQFTLCDGSIPTCWCGLAVATHGYETVGRGWKLLCDECYEYSTEILKMYVEILDPHKCYCDGPCKAGFIES